MITKYNNKDYIIKDIKAREILDSRGYPTVEVDVYTENNIGRASVPSGSSVGSYEAFELRDNDLSRYFSKGVSNAVDIINSKIKTLLVGKDIRNQREIDYIMIELDGTKLKKNIGSNSILPVSIAVAKTAALCLNLPLYRYLGGINSYTLPIPTFNIINGGKHAGNNLSIQEFMIQPIKSLSFKEALRVGSEVYHNLGIYLKKNYGISSINVGYEGGYSPLMNSTEDALDSLTISIENSGYSCKEIKIGIDVASSELYDNTKKIYSIDNREYDKEELYDYYINLSKSYPIYSIEDPFFEDDFDSFQKLTKKLKDIIIVGDDLLATNPDRIKYGISKNAISGLLIKPNQIGSLSEVFDASNIAKKGGLSLFISHRSSETEDTTIADISVAINANMIKSGAPSHGERICKYNRLLRIEEELNMESEFLHI